MKKIITILILMILIFSCCAKKANTQPITDSDSDGVADFQDVELEEPEYNVEDSKNIELPNTGSDRVIQSQLPKMSQEIESPIIVPKYEKGRLVYEIPKEMVKLQTYTIVVKISRNLTDVTIYDNIKVVIDTVIRTSELMQVELIDPTNTAFKIISNTPKQFIDTYEPTTWEFFVTPLKKGNNELKVVVSIIKDGNIKQTVYSDNVIVKTSTWLEVKLWLQSYWQWFFVVILLPIGKYVHSKYKRNEKD